MAAEGRFFLLLKNLRRVRTEMVLALFLVWGRCGDKQKKHKQIGKIIAVGENSAFCMCKKIKKRKNI